ncbi:MAG: acyl-CoA carboxylase subunit beta [Chromatiales bacterium]|jgi:geranyl-CoA carboxylase beta subunit|nr:acyl-CoA carboxylase subunit beta [Chromatiales bacterium]
MAVFQTKLAKGPQYAGQRDDMLSLVDELRALAARTTAASERRKPRFRERGQLTPRERLARLLDPGMPFLEVYNLANYLFDTGDPQKSLAGASVIAGIGFVSGVRCMVIVDDSGINAGAMSEMSIEKIVRCLDLALKQKLPVMHLVESAGADLIKYKVELWARGGGIFYRLAKLSATGIPTFVVLHGPSTAGGAYMPGMSDYVIGVRGRGRAALGGAALVRAATGEVADEEALSGSHMHASVSGLVEYLAEDDAHGISIARDLMARLQWNKRCPQFDRPAFEEPVYSADEIAGIVPIDYQQPYDVREVIARLVDESDFIEFKPLYGASVVCAQASVYGHACCLIGNNGPIDPNGATKAAQFFQLADQADTPLIFLNNITGYMVGLAYERAGMIKHGSKMIQAVSNVRVPRITLYIGASFGAGNYGMCGHAYEPDFLFAWPNATTGVMGGTQAARTMSQVMRLAAERRDQPLAEGALEEQEKTLTEVFDSQSGAFYTSGRLLDQGVIDPRDSRKVLGFALDSCWEARHRRLQPNSFGVARQ